jgi:hypothetical protein
VKSNVSSLPLSGERSLGDEKKKRAYVARWIKTEVESVSSDAITSILPDLNMRTLSKLQSLALLLILGSLSWITFEKVTQPDLDILTTKNQKSSVERANDRTAERSRDRGSQEPIHIEGLPDWVHTLKSDKSKHLSDFEGPLDPAEVNKFVDYPPNRRHHLTTLIYRATVRKDTRFRYLLENDDLRNDPQCANALLAYDYSVNGNEQALGNLLDAHRAEHPGSDCESVVVLALLNEWDLSISALHEHFTNRFEGSGLGGYKNFWVIRKALYPQTFNRLTN